MFYRCRVCREEVQHGWLPPATCMVYSLFLGAVSVGCLYLAVSALRATLEAHRQPAAPPEPAPWWWAWVVALPITLALVWLVAALLHMSMKLVEWLTIRRQPCPVCGARRWSWGYTKTGFGL